ncbi:unnamed protein product [Danaus chrysippus]|uniref:(African queen) hypothetical protein n=1 Tax=Danaus chrysippus TaxID=151541 RepID=A0A8J2VQ03_9NEOP|nr:unnamed protein product [Danaus chrysippus]
MSPRKQPPTLFKLAVRSSLKFINDCCYDIEKEYSENELKKYKRRILALKTFLLATLPARLFDALCLERKHIRYRGDPRVQLHVLIHPRMTVFRRSETDTSITQHFWLKTIPWFSRLVVLDLKFLCTDEILEVVATKCHLLEELNMVSRVDVCKSVINASVLLRNVSDVGLCCVSHLKKLKVLSMDPPRHEKCSRVGRCVTQAGIIMLICELPKLEELNIESCDIGSTLIGTGIKIGPLSLKKVNCHFASADGIRKLIQMCPDLQELSITHLTTNDKELILAEITSSNLRLNKLNMSFFSYTDSLRKLLQVQGKYLTHFSLWDIDQSITMDAVVNIGLCCPNLTNFSLITQSDQLTLPPSLTRSHKIFKKIRYLTLGNENFDLEKVMMFFLNHSDGIESLVLKYQVKLPFNNVITNILNNGYLNNITNLWLDCTLDVSKDVVMKLILNCDELTTLTADFGEALADIVDYINDNNLNLRLGGY